MTMLCDWCQHCWLNAHKMTSKCLAKQNHDKRYHQKCRHFLPNIEIQGEVFTQKSYKEFAKFYGKDVAEYVLSKVK